MDADAFRTAAHSAIEEIISYRQSLSSRRVLSAVSPGYLAPQLPSSAPHSAIPWSEIQPDIKRFIQPGLTHWDSPHFMAFFPACVSYPSILGEMYSAAFTAPAFNWICSPASTELEGVVIDWLADAMGLGDAFLSKGEGGGVVQGSASEAVVVAMVAARERALRELTEGLEGEAREEKMDEIRVKLVALGSEHAHSCTAKAARIAGVKFRTVAAGAETDYAMGGEELRKTIAEVRKKGWVPFYLTATLGTTSSCAIDKMAEIVEVIQAPSNEQLWVHIDAAYAGSALICSEHRHLANEFQHFDSVCFNLHKWLLVNFDASCLFFKKRSHVTTALSTTPAYLSNTFSASGLVTDYRDWQIPLGRRFRALKIYFVLKIYGIAGLQAHIRKAIRLGEYMESLLKSREDIFERLTETRFGLNVFCVRPEAARGTNGTHHSEEANGTQTPIAAENPRPESGSEGKNEANVDDSAAQNSSLPLRPANLHDPRHEELTNDFTPDAEAQARVQAERPGAEAQTSPSHISSTHQLALSNALTKQVYERINERGPIYLTSTVIGERYCIRVVSANEQAAEKYVKEAFGVIVEETEGVLSGKGGEGEGVKSE